MESSKRTKADRFPGIGATLFAKTLDHISQIAPDEPHGGSAAADVGMAQRSELHYIRTQGGSLTSTSKG